TRAKQALIDSSRGQKLFPNNPSRDLVVVLKIQGVRGPDRLGLFDRMHVLVKGEKREFNSMSIPDNENRPIWAAAVGPTDAQELTLVLGEGYSPLSCRLDGPVVELAKMSD